MKKICTLLFSFSLFTFHFSFAQSPSWVWAKSAGGISNEYSNATCTDANGNVYITGTFQGSTITFGSYTLQNTATGTLDVFVVKYDASGNVLWARSGGGAKDDYAYGISADPDGNIYTTGHFESRFIIFGTTILTNADSTGNCDIFITKYNSIGNVLWSKSVLGKGGCEVSYCICTDANGNAYITGRFASKTIFFGNDSLTNRAEFDIFIAKYDASGNVLWAKSAGASQEEGGQGICTDPNGNVYITGFFQNSAIFGNDTIIGPGNSNIFVAKYNTFGNKVWAKSVVKPSAGNDAYGIGITADAASNIYLTGFFQYSVSFGSDTLGNAGNYSVFIAKYDSSGNALWGRSPGGTNYDYGNSISADASGNVFVTGYFSSSFLNFGGNPVINSFNGYDDIFVAAYDGGGNALWAKSVGGTDNEYGMGICAGGGSVYVTGYFGSYTCNFGSTTVTNNGSYDVFLAKLNSYTGIEENSKSACQVFPNPSNGQFTVYGGLTPGPSPKERGEGARIAVYNVMGEKVYSQLIGNNYNNQIPVNLKLNEGIYFLQLTNGRESLTQKIVIE